MPIIRFEDAPRTENVQGRHVRHCSQSLGSAEIMMGRTTKTRGRARRTSTSTTTRT
jgi:hypothetical protein